MAKGTITTLGATDNPTAFPVGTDGRAIIADSTSASGLAYTASAPLIAGNNLSDVASAATARANLGITREVYNASVASQGAGFATDTYVTGSSCAVPASSLQAKTIYHCIIQATKTSAGTATPIIILRFGTNGSTGDAALCTVTFTAGTGATDTGTFEVWATFATVGSGTSAAIIMASQRRHGASVTGFGNLVSEAKAVTSSGFDSTVANSIIGISLNGGASASWTVNLVQAELRNLL